jgi:hypothetical protein
VKITTAALAAAILLAGTANVLRADVTTTAQDSTQTPAQLRTAKREGHLVKRLDMHNKHIRELIKDGTMTQDQGNTIGDKDEGIRKEMKEMEDKNGGSLTKANFKKLEMELNDTGDAIHAIEGPKAKQ